MKTLTIRNVPPDLAEALQDERARSGTSLNQTVLDLLHQRLGVGVVRSNGLARLAGTWTDEEFEQFQAVTAVFEQVDEELWK
jgi:plasmid stability protein